MILGRANEDVVRRLVNHLLRALEEFNNEEARGKETGLSYADAFMGAHNFHKLMVLDLEERTEDLECFWRTAAVHTFLESLSKGE